MAEGNCQVPQEGRSWPIIHLPEPDAIFVRPEAEPLLECGDPFQIQYADIRWVAGNVNGVDVGFFVHWIVKQPVQRSFRIRASALAKALGCGSSWHWVKLRDPNRRTRTKGKCPTCEEQGDVEHILNKCKSKPREYDWSSIVTLRTTANSRNQRKNHNRGLMTPPT
ncbi:hypothetical protein BDM02DRAFT_894587 [Thelephora ganbajun]|uniref:Uncharacterized protein n=1 Tax=Thelephora ganbajun TaxID=370292 RepID=A0ACB6Z4Z3_THEGA|nr:hypothetical protein BDM02DRAFT_894587 [Thelephora ganbajun]